MTAVHAALGGALVVVNLLAAAAGAWTWWTGRGARAFWPLLRAGQALVVLQALDGGVLVALGRELPELHLVYGLVPLGVSFMAEQLRLASADAVLRAHGMESSDEVRGLPEHDQHALVTEIVRRETAVMAVSAAVVTALGMRAGGLL